jgi:hypothetical protein
MDLIGSLASAAGIDARSATAVAGAVLGLAKQQSGDDETAKLQEAIPELSGWEETAKAVASEAAPAEEEEGGIMSGLLSAAGSGLGNQLLGAVAGEGAAEKAAAVSVLSKLGLQPAHAALVAPVVLSFLEQRLGGEWSDRIVAAAPILAGLKQPAKEEPESPLGGIASTIGSLFG